MKPENKVPISEDIFVIRPYWIEERFKNLIHKGGISSLFQLKKDYTYILMVIPIILLYSILFFGKDVAATLTREDHLVEWTGALSFLMSSLLFFSCFKYKKSTFYILLGLLFLFGFLEEISWGQRIFGIKTSNTFMEYNRQHEINIHNLKWFHGLDESGMPKDFWKKLLNIDRLFSLFWFCFCVFTPIIYNMNKKFADLMNRVVMPIAPLFISFLFLFNYFVSKVFEFIFNDMGHSVVEIKETAFAYLFLVFATHELKNSIYIKRSSNKSVA